MSCGNSCPRAARGRSAHWEPSTSPSGRSVVSGAGPPDEVSYRIRIAWRVKGHFNGIPMVEVRYRLGQLLNVRGEKVSEEAFYRVLSEVATFSGLKIRDYTTIESPLLEARYSSPFYKVYLELADESEEDVKALGPG